MGARCAAVADHGAYKELKTELSGSNIEAGGRFRRGCGRRHAVRPTWDIGAITGVAGLEPSLAAIERGATLALANK
jgi:1-deoxy-D-xylulose-5-phosphate reductoisomerase